MSWLDALGWAGSALLVFSVMQARVLRFRALNLLACLVLTLFNGLLEIWPMVAMNVVLSAINVWFLVRMLRERHDEKAFEVLEVSPTDDYLRHVLRIHGGDILKFQPDFVWDGAEPGHRSYLVLHGDETVGVVLVRDEGNGTAQVVLDYVTRRYRDFSPGEFVWRRSRLLKESGFERVITPPGMVAPYYDRLQFRREGDSFTLDL
ncbi:MAG TPA: hypothetical protein VFG72_12885 [Marmoricola sp.]|nr:hypothetical protein [Marmoricola sp.]